jgi:hypothetical protein
MVALDAMNFIEDDTVYEVDVVTANPFNVFFQIQGDSWFRWTKSLCFKNAVDGEVENFPLGDQPISPAFVQIRDMGSERDLFQVPVKLASVFGGLGWNKSTAIPFILPLPRLFKPKSLVQITLSYTAGAAAIGETLHLQFVGTKLFRL